MTLQNLLTNGYFSEELPPPFTTHLLGANISKIQSIISSLPTQEVKLMKESDFVRYSTPKTGIHRRPNGIPNPYHQIKLSEAISSHWVDIEKLYKGSPLSASIPEIDTTGKRSIVQFAKYEEYKEKCLVKHRDPPPLAVVVYSGLCRMLTFGV
ncbi:MAG: hypothetical protein P4L51_04075 [Puia sp.]|nr:hypothetical protein [Puia sp.]